MIDAFPFIILLLRERPPPLAPRNVYHGHWTHPHQSLTLLDLPRTVQRSTKDHRGQILCDARVCV